MSQILYPNPWYLNLSPKEKKHTYIYAAITITFLEQNTNNYNYHKQTKKITKIIYLSS